MKRFLSFIIWTVLLTVLSFHNTLMVFWDSTTMSMWSMEMESTQWNCHEDLNTVEECVSICCYDDDLVTTSISNFQTQNNKKYSEKIKYTLVELSFSKSLIYEWDLIWNISPPDIVWITIDYSYTSLTWVIKSNT